MKLYVFDGMVMLFVLWNLCDFGYLVGYVVVSFVFGVMDGLVGSKFIVGWFKEYMIFVFFGSIGLLVVFGLL